MLRSETRRTPRRVAWNGLGARGRTLLIGLAVLVVVVPAGTARAASDLSVSGDRSAASVWVGKRLVFTLTVSNGGPDPALAVSLVVSGVPTREVVRVGSTRGRCQAGRAVRCQLGDLAPGDTATVRVHLRPIRPGPLTANATISSDDPDPSPANDTATVRAHAALRRGACANALGGTAGGDVFPGTRGGDRLVGGGGADRLFGGPGEDCLFGESGGDRLVGGPGHDRISGGSGTDELFGGAGDDSLSGGDGNDVMIAGPGDDVIRSNAADSGTDLVDCGAGNDTAYLSPGTLVRGCEQVTVIPRGCEHRGHRVVCPQQSPSPTPAPAPSPTPNGGGGSGGGGGGGGGGGRRRKHCRHRHGHRYCPIGGVNQKTIRGRPPPSPVHR
jgi:hypothetical protein